MVEREIDDRVATGKLGGQIVADIGAGDDLEVRQAGRATDQRLAHAPLGAVDDELCHVPGNHAGGGRAGRGEKRAGEPFGALRRPVVRQGCRQRLAMTLTRKRYLFGLPLLTAGLLIVIGNWSLRAVHRTSRPSSRRT